MTKITLATFNCENLFRRFKFSEKASQNKIDNAVQNGFIVNESLFKRIIPDEKKLTAKAIIATKADIVCLQEVENMETLKSFCSRHLKGNHRYDYRMLIDANDPRLIDVALISKIPIDSVVTHQFVKGASNRPVFSRDCLEVRFKIGTKLFTVFINHFKSMLDMGAATPAQSRANTAPRREAQVNAVIDILKTRFGKNPGTKAWAVVGDFNDYPDETSSLNELLKQTWVENIVDRLPATERWTHWWDTTKVPIDERYKQLDYILLSRSLAKANPTVKPVIVRNGLATKANKYTGPRFPDTGPKTSASDHCPVGVTITI